MVLGYGAASFISSRLGRKPVLIAVLVIAMISQLTMVIAQYSHSLLQIFFLFVWIICDALSVTSLVVLNMYIVDISGADERYAS